MILSLDKPCPRELTVDRAIPLNLLRAGQSAQVERVVGREDQVHRLEEFGLLGGARIEMFRRGNPCIIRLAGGKMCLRADDLLNVLVRPTLPR
jgi:Fe2+ transport system protein FeoA